MTLRPCIECGELNDGSRCTDCGTQARKDHGNAGTCRPSRAAGYDTAWDALSLRARRLQPWCSDCGTTDDLTTDHSERAWKRKAEGKSIRLRDVDVVCRRCNSERGSSRPGGQRSSRHAGSHLGEAKFQSLTGCSVTRPLSVDSNLAENIDGPHVGLELVGHHYHFGNDDHVGQCCDCPVVADIVSEDRSHARFHRTAVTPAEVASEKRGPLVDSVIKASIRHPLSLS